MIWLQMLQMQSLVYGSVLLAFALPHAVAVISRGDPVQGFATFYGGPQVRCWYVLWKGVA